MKHNYSVGFYPPRHKLSERGHSVFRFIAANRKSINCYICLMKYTFVFLLAVGILCSCKKSSSGGSSLPPTLASMTVYFPNVHTIDVQTFTFNGTQLTQYSVQSIDTTNTQIDEETTVYSFQYTTSQTLPASSSFQATAYEGSTLLNGGGVTQNFVYDNNNRLVEDSSLPVSGQSNYNYYSYVGDSVSFIDSATLGGSYPAGGLDIVNGNIAVNSEVFITYGSSPNPLYYPAIGNTFGVYFFAGLIGFGVLPNYSLPVDFISKNLPTSWNGPNGNAITTFSWTKGPDGKVTGGTALNLFSSLVGYGMTAQITFTYQ